MASPVSLSTPTQADREEFIAAAQASKAAVLPWVDPPDSRERYAAYLERSARDEFACFLVRHLDCGRLVGFVNINNIVRGGFQSGYLGYAGFVTHAGKGLMSAGVAAVVGTAFGELGLHRLEANIQPANARSLALARRLGFRREGLSPHYLMVDGQWRDHERWAMLADEWPAAAPPG
jgi:ribosomal-protein-alanine N-acetyltransferase